MARVRSNCSGDTPLVRLLPISFKRLRSCLLAGSIILLALPSHAVWHWMRGSALTDFKESDWAMIRDRFDWRLSNLYTQRLVINTDPNTPDNIQDTNVFTLGANMFYPVSARQTFTLFPQYRNFYYEIQNIDNQQGSLLARWDYQLNSTTNVGWNASVQAINYQTDQISDISYTRINFTASSSRAPTPPCPPRSACRSAVTTTGSAAC